MKLPLVAEQDEAIRDYLETTHIYDEASGESWKPTTLPSDPTPDPDEPEN